MKIGNIEFKNNIILAPMAGITDVAFRSICIEFGADCGVTEMISAKALFYDNEKTKDLLFTEDNEKIKIVQIFGHESDILSKMCQSKFLDKFDIIDINMGCPAPKIVSNGDGSALMLDLDKAENIISSCVKAIKKPITVKFRSGYSDDKINALEFAKMCERAGASAITIHPRTRTQMYSGNVDLDIIKQIKKSVSIPVIASGDIVDYMSLKHTFEYTKCDAVMVGRATLGNPEIFSELLNKKICINKYDLIEKHIKLLRKYYSDNFIVGHIRKHILWYIKGERNCISIKNKILEETSINSMLKILKDFFYNDNNTK